MEKPILKNEIEAKINGVSKVEDNIIEAKEYALQLKEYYSNLVFTEEQLKEAKDERASINKIVKKIADYRKNIVAEFNKPIELFETTAKETEKILKETADFVDGQVKVYEEKEKAKKKQQIETIFTELANKKSIDELINLNMLFDERYLNKTYELKDVEKDLSNKIQKIVDELEAIKNLKSDNELALTNLYLKEFDLTKIINENNRLNELKKSTERLETKKEEIKQEKIEQMLTEEIKTENIDPIKEYTLKITAPLSKQQALKKFLELNNMKFERID